ncbi:hypothetical protein [Prosthecobacter sp.]|uniref:hypothetical protein n=1 Tax=Prosthecobacter sp. TaxID=1965333 RepID=UPI0037848FBB
MSRLLHRSLIALLICCAGTLTLTGQTTAARDTSSPQKSLLGHWVARSAAFGDTHYYFSTGKLTMVDTSAEKGMTYTVQQSNDKERWVRIRVLMPSGLGHDKNLAFSADASTLVSTIKDFEQTEYKHPTQWTYVDARQAP